MERIANRINYQKELTAFLEEHKGERVLLHSCCAPCSSTCIEFLDRYVPVTVFYFNPNITDRSEYEFRLSEQKRLVKEMPLSHKVEVIEGRYEPEEFFALARGLETAPEKGPRCVRCYTLRLEETMKKAGELGFPYFATTLTLSPLKPSDVINRIGAELAGCPEEINPGAIRTDAGTAEEKPDGTGPLYLPSDFKKNDGYKRSIELSKEYGLYRQDYCGCVFSKRHES